MSQTLKGGMVKFFHWRTSKYVKCHKKAVFLKRFAFGSIK